MFTLKKKAIFLDRDGVLNTKRDDYVKSPSELEILPNIIPALKKLIEKNFHLFIITNQSIINRKIITRIQEDEINKKLLKFLNSNNVDITEIYICPHRPDENCLCRKPNSGLIEKAIFDYDIDVNQSWFIGDSDSDKQASLRVGCKFVLNKTNDDINKAVKFIFKNS